MINRSRQYKEPASVNRINRSSQHNMPATVNAFTAAGMLQRPLRLTNINRSGQLLNRSGQFMLPDSVVRWLYK